MPRGWTVEERRADAAELHASWPRVDDSPQRRAVAVCHAPTPSVVLGSTQPAEVIDRARAVDRGVSVARRRSGGGAVLVTPSEPVWVDLWLPVNDPLWSDDVSRAFDWVGEAWVAALEQLGLPGLAAQTSGPLACTEWSRQVCFGGIGSGEVVEDGQRKVVGLAQRRTRRGAWFHCACALHWEAAPLVELLAMSAEERARAVRDLDDAAVGVVDLADAAGAGRVEAQQVIGALIDSLPPTASS